MLEPHFDRLRSEIGDAVRQPDFTSVRRRAGRVRRRRLVTSGAVFLATVLTATGLGYAVQNGPDDRGVVGAGPATSGAPDDDWPQTTSVTTTGTEVYSVRLRCRACDPELYASSDRGASWQRRTIPPKPADAADPRAVMLISLAPETFAWRDSRRVSIQEAIDSGVPADGQSPATGPENPTPPDPLWITSDGGRGWRRVAVDTQPVTAVPAGSRPVDCDMQEVSTCAVAVIDPATGRFAPLAGQPTGITVDPYWMSQVNVPLDGHLWVPGLDPATNKPAVATSSDAGRTWRTHVFTDGVAAVVGRGGTAGGYLPHVAAGSGETAYVLTYRAENVVDAHYTSDGGLTWRAGATIRDGRSFSDFVTADGSHIVTTGSGLVVGRGTGQYTPVTLPGYPEDPWQMQIGSRQAAERYLVTSGTGPYLSADGRTWRQIHLP